MLMKFSKVVLLNLLILLGHSNLIACRCGASGFCENLSSTSTVVEAKAINIYDESDLYFRFIDIEITDFLYGLDTLSYDTLTLAIGYTSCDPHSFFKSDTGDSFVFIIQNLKNMEEALHPTFRFNICHSRYLFIEGDSIMGLFENLDHLQKEDTVVYASFKDNIENACELSLTTFHLEPLTNVLSVFPNPTQDELRIKMSHRQDVEYIIYSNIGKRMKAEKKVQRSDFRIDIRGFLPGVYYLRFQIEEQILYKKVIKL